MQILCPIQSDNEIKFSEFCEEMNYKASLEMYENFPEENLNLPKLLLQ